MSGFDAIDYGTKTKTMPNRYSAFTNDALGVLDATAITERIRRREISLEEALDAAVLRAKGAQDVLCAMAATDFDRVKLRAKRFVDPAGLLSVPAFVKDNVNLAGLPTRFGSKATTSRPARMTDGLVAQLEACGLYMIGKSTTPAFGFGCTTEFDDGSSPTKNPWNLSLSAGGSSGGAAALVASGVVPMAHANDGGGSIRIPAAICGLVGLKPSRGRLVRNRKGDLMPIDIVSDGVVTRTVRDTANFFYEAERYFQPPKLSPIGRVEGPSKKRLRVGVIYDSVLTSPCAETRRAVDDTVTLLTSLGHDVEETQFEGPPRFARDFSLYWGFLAFSVERFGPRIFSNDFDPGKLDALTRGLAKHFRKHPVEAIRAISYLRRVKEADFVRTSKYDVVLSPVLARTTPALGVLSPAVPFDVLFERLQQYVGYTPLANVAGTPAISLPLARSRDGEPIGLQFSAPFGEERRLLELAFELEEARPWPQLWSAS